jgi:hypothetical protein
MGDFKAGVIVNTGIYHTFCTVNTGTKTNFKITQFVLVKQLILKTTPNTPLAGTDTFGN